MQDEHGSCCWMKNAISRDVQADPVQRGQCIGGQACIGFLKRPRFQLQTSFTQHLKAPVLQRTLEMLQLKYPQRLSDDIFFSAARVLDTLRPTTAEASRAVTTRSASNDDDAHRL